MMIDADKLYQHLADIYADKKPTPGMTKDEKTYLLGVYEGIEIAQEAILSAKMLATADQTVKPCWRQGKPSCGACGLPISKGQRFCPNCGKKVNWDG